MLNKIFVKLGLKSDDENENTVKPKTIKIDDQMKDRLDQGLQ